MHATKSLPPFLSTVLVENFRSYQAGWPGHHATVLPVFVLLAKQLTPLPERSRIAHPTMPKHKKAFPAPAYTPHEARPADFEQARWIACQKLCDVLDDLRDATVCMETENYRQGAEFFSSFYDQVLKKATKDLKMDISTEELAAQPADHAPEWLRQGIAEPK